MQLSKTANDFRPWFHNLHLPDGTQTAPEHPLGDFPRRVWKDIEPYIPEDLHGKTVLDIGCNAGFYSIELARRGAEVTAIDHDPHYLQQAIWAAEQFGLTNIRFQQRQIYDLARTDETYDIVWFMGVMYHLRYPLLGLDIVARKVREQLVFQTMQLPETEHVVPPEDMGLDDRQLLLQSGWPRMAFVENRLADDPTNWWVANQACVHAMLRSCGLEVTQQVSPEVCLCKPTGLQSACPVDLINQEYEAAIGRSAAADEIAPDTDR